MAIESARSDVAAELERLRTEARELREIVSHHPDLFRKFCIDECITALQQTAMFSDVPIQYLEKMAAKMSRQNVPAGTSIAHENSPTGDVMVIASGDVRRWATIDGREQVVSTFCPHSIGTLRFSNPATAVSRYNALCLTDAVIYAIQKDDLDGLMDQYPQIPLYMVTSLTKYIRSQQATFATPLLEQRAHKFSYVATGIAATIESFYRSALNAFINQRINGGELGKLFPHMHIQTPTRVVYMTGIKQIRAVLDEINCNQYQFPTLARILISFAPGVLMSPFSSVLEAANAGEKNPEPMSRRWLRGYVPRLGREIIFGVGMNQLADFCAERMNGFSSNQHITRSAGSLAAGITAGYLSHIPHNLSTKKLMQPHRPYHELWKDLYMGSLKQVPLGLPQPTRVRLAKICAVVFPIGVVRRSIQIAGTFMLINGITYCARNQDWV